MPVQQHPVPQNVSSYKFRLVGDMTLKQFLQLAVGIILGVVAWSSPLPFFFKYPLAIILVCLGAGIAFVPVAGRPMDQWLIAFIKSIYSPTIYTWQKQEVKKEKPTPPPSKPTSPKSPSQTHSSPQTKPPPPSSPPSPAPPPPQKQPTPPSINKLPVPFTPTTPNTLVGMVLTPDGTILEDAIIEIIRNGLTTRATKSNQLGQFLFAKPLENGTYHIITQKNNYQFNTYALKLTGKIVPPLKLQAQNT